MQDLQTKPNGPVAAAFVAAGVGALVLGIFVVLNEVSTDISNFLKFDANYGLGSGVGPLSGKAILATIAFFGSWLGLGLWVRAKEVNFGRWFAVSLVLVLAGFALTFPPIFEFIVELFPAAE
ncbi:MAG: hypothetical protein AB1736_04445 [Chloroflexota bacterium]